MQNWKEFIQNKLILITVIVVILGSVASTGIVQHKYFNPLTAISSILSKIGIGETEVRLEVLEVGFQNLDEFRRRYERAKEICEASYEELRENLFKTGNLGGSCGSEDQYNELVFTRPQEFRQKYPNRVEDYPEGKIYYCPKCTDYVMSKPGAMAEEMLRCVSSEDSGGNVYENRNGQKTYYTGCTPENIYNEIVFSTPERWQKYSVKVGSYYCDPQRLSEVINDYRKNESREDGVGGCNLAEEYKELYQSVMKSGL